jgi:hypothetical protein
MTGAFLAALALATTPACPATPVDVEAERVRIGPFRGELAGRYDIVDGRFRLHVGSYRDLETGLTQKIPWFAPRSSDVGERLTITGRRLYRRARPFTQRFGRAGTSSSTDPYVYPSIIRMPAPGCWRLTFRSGEVTAKATVLATRRSR